MQLIEIIVIISALAIVLGVIGNYIYRKKHHLPTGECACCKKGKSNFVKAYRKKYH